MDLNREAVEWLSSSGASRVSSAAHQLAPAFHLLHKALRRGLADKDLLLLAETWSNLGLAYKKFSGLGGSSSSRISRSSGPCSREELDVETEEEREHAVELAIYNLQLAASLLRRVQLEVTGPAAYGAAASGASPTKNAHLASQVELKLASLFLNLSILHHQKGASSYNRDKTSTTSDKSLEFHTALQYAVQCVDTCVTALLEQQRRAETESLCSTSSDMNLPKKPPEETPKLYAALALGYHQLGLCYEKVCEYRKAYCCYQNAEQVAVSCLGVEHEITKIILESTKF